MSVEKGVVEELPKPNVRPRPTAEKVAFDLMGGEIPAAVNGEKDFLIAFLKHQSGRGISPVKPTPSLRQREFWGQT